MDILLYLVLAVLAVAAVLLLVCLVRACTMNPACAIGAQDQVGSIATGKLADFIICRSDYTGRRVFMGGQEL